MPFSGPSRTSRPLPDLTLSALREGAVTVIALRGEADVATLPALTAMLARVCAEHVGPVVVDMANTGFVDTATVRTLLRAWEFLGEHGRELTFRAPSRQATRLLAFAGLSDLITADLITADLTTADLTTADLTTADLTTADLTTAGPDSEPDRSSRSDDPGEPTQDPVRLHLARAAHPSSPCQG
jgi:anti-sigma B factor antagonist